MGIKIDASFSRKDKQYLEAKAKEHLIKAGEQIKRNVFISFAHEDMGDVNWLRTQAKDERTGLEFSDYSVKKEFNSEDAEYIKRQIREKLEKVSVTMVYLSDNSMNSEWVKWEIEQSKKMGKGVIGVYQKDNYPTHIPKQIKENITDIVPWKHESIMSAVEKANEER